MEQETAVITENESKMEVLKKQVCRIETKAYAKNAMQWIKSKWKISMILYILLAVFVLHCVVVGISDCRNYYMTPIKTAARLENMDTYDIEEASLAAWNGLGEKPLKKMTKILRNSDGYVEMMEGAEALLLQGNALKKEVYGEDYLLTVTEQSKRPLSEAELREYRRDIRELISEIGYLVDESEEFKATDWREVADDSELTKDEAKKLIQVYGEYVDEMEPVQVTEGYEVRVQTTITGEKQEKPEVSQNDITVVKVNGRWVMLDTFDTMDYFFDMMG